MKFIIDNEKEMSCNFGEYDLVSGIITINLGMMDAPEEFIITVLHEELHKLIEWGTYPQVTDDDEDHYVISRLLCV